MTTDNRADVLALADCPFCGGNDLDTESVNAVQCRACGGGVCIEGIDDDRRVRRVWNTRVIPPNYSRQPNHCAGVFFIPIQVPAAPAEREDR